MTALQEWLSYAPTPTPLNAGQRWHVFISSPLSQSILGTGTLRYFAAAGVFRFSRSVCLVRGCSIGLDLRRGTRRERFSCHGVVRFVRRFRVVQEGVQLPGGARKPGPRVSICHCEIGRNKATRFRARQDICGFLRAARGSRRQRYSSDASRLGWKASPRKSCASGRRCRSRSQASACRDTSCPIGSAMQIGCSN